MSRMWGPGGLVSIGALVLHGMRLTDRARRLVEKNGHHHRVPKECMQYTKCYLNN